MNEKDLMINEIWSLYQNIERKEFGFKNRLSKCKKGVFLNIEDFQKNFINRFERIDTCDEKTHLTCVTIAEKMAKLNEYVRMENYQLYLNMNSEELNKSKNKDIAKYTELVNRIFNFRRTKEIITESNLNDIYKDVSNYEYIYDHENVPYDTLYATIKSILDNNNYLYYNFYEDMLKMCKYKIEKLQDMSLDEYRNYKIELLKLSDKELKQFNESNNKKTK